MHQGETTKTTPMASFCGALACIVSRGDRNTRNFCSIIPFLSSEKYYHILNTMWRSRISAKDRRRQPTDQVTYLEGKIREPIMSGERRGDEYRIQASAGDRLMVLVCKWNGGRPGGRIEEDMLTNGATSALPPSLERRKRRTTHVAAMK